MLTTNKKLETWSRETYRHQTEFD